VNGPPRRVLLASTVGTAAVILAGTGTAYELVSHGVLPGKAALDRFDGACSAGAADLSYSQALGPTVAGALHSSARGRDVGYTIGYPPGHRPGDELPLVVALHGYGGNHLTALANLTPASAMALRGTDGRPLPPVALVSVDGGNGYWNPHPGDDPMAMLVDELIPLCQRRGLGRPPHRIGVVGISMGGYGALLLAEMHPALVSAVAAISPAIWTSYAQARAANAGAYASAAAFAANDAVTHAHSLSGVPVRVAAGYGDPFYPGVQALAAALPHGAVVVFAKGCHDDSFFASQELASLEFLAQHLA